MTEFHVRAYLLSIKERLKPYSFYDYSRAIKRYFNWLVEEKILAESPMTGWKPPLVPKTIIQPLKVEHLQLLLAQCNTKTFIGIRNKAIIFTFLDTGLRLSELAYIKIEDVDFHRGIIKVMGKGSTEPVYLTAPSHSGRPSPKYRSDVTSLHGSGQEYNISDSSPWS